MSETNDCIFCAIASGNQPSHTVYEDDDVIAFLDINPLARGHTLVVPREHYDRLEELPESVAASVGTAIVRLTDVVQRTVGADGTTVGFNNGSAAGQVVPHVHGHVVPRFQDDGGRNLHAIVPESARSGDEDFDALADEIRSAFSDE